MASPGNRHYLSFPIKLISKVASLCWHAAKSPNGTQTRWPPVVTKSSAIAEGPRDVSCQLKSCQLPRNSAETTYMTSPDQIDGMKLEI